MSGNFKYLDDLIHGKSKEIFLDCDISMKSSESSDYLHGIRIDVDDIVIDGLGHTIDANYLARIFSISAKNVQIKNLKLTRGYSSSRSDEEKQDGTFGNPAHPRGYGGAIYNRGKVDLINCEFLNNYSWSFGGAIVNMANLKIMDCCFKNNSGYNGGAIFNRSDLEIQNTDFTRNGGPIFTNSFGKLGLYGETTKFGGAILNEYSLKMNNCTFTHNYARDGGAINNFFGKIKAFNILFSNNASKFTAAVNNFGGNVLISDSSFSDNVSNKKWDAYFDIFKLNAKDLDSYEMQSNKNSGAIFNNNVFNLQNCKFVNNIGFANSIYNIGGAFLIINETLFSGDFDNEIKGYGEVKRYCCEFNVI